MTAASATSGKAGPRTERSAGCLRAAWPSIRFFEDADLELIGHDMTVNSDGRNEREVAQWRDADTQPVLSPDGRQIAFLRSRELFTIGLDGTGLRQLTRSGGVRTSAGRRKEAGFSSRSRLLVRQLRSESSTQTDRVSRPSSRRTCSRDSQRSPPVDKSTQLYGRPTANAWRSVCRGLSQRTR